MTKYPHISKSFVTVEKLKWSRIPVDGKDHKHSFVRDGGEVEFVKVEVDATEGKDKVKASVTGGLKDLLGESFGWWARDEDNADGIRVHSSEELRISVRELPEG